VSWILIEILLGAWLIIGVAPAGSWLAAVMVFLVFAWVSGYSAWIGEASCECFGQLKVSPWYTLALDLGLLVLLALFRPRAKKSGFPLRMLPQLARGVLGVGVLAGLLIAASWIWFGSPHQALAQLKGERLTLDPRHVHLGKGRQGERKAVALTVRNRTDRPVVLIGGSADCCCAVGEGLPATIGPGGSMPVTIHVTLPAPRKAFSRGRSGSLPTTPK
jgi:hypothetical protein